jgi:soluble lytic murein transglycosylase-like protein
MVSPPTPSSPSQPPPPSKPQPAPAPAAAKASNPTLSFDQVKQHVETNNKSTKVSNELVICLIWRESSFNPSAQSAGSTATGLMQITKGAVEEVNNNTSKGVHFEHNEMTDPAKNIQCGTYYLDLRIKKAKDDTARGVDGFGTGRGYSKNILECEKCLKSEPKNKNDCLFKIHK